MKIPSFPHSGDCESIIQIRLKTFFTTKTRRTRSFQCIELNRLFFFVSSCLRGAFSVAGRGLQPRPKRLMNEDMAVIIENSRGGGGKPRLARESKMKIPSFPRSSVGMQLATLRRRVWQRWSVAGYVPTPERGNDKMLFFLALSFYTRLPHPQTLDYNRLPQAAIYLPLIGWLVGGICALIFYLADLVWPQSTAVILALITGILLTSALHEDGFADVCDGFGGGMNKQRILEIMKDSHIGVYGVVGLLLLLLLKVSVLSAMPAAAPLVLLSGHSLSRLSPLLLMQRYAYARGNDSKSSGAVYKPNHQELLFSTVIALLPLALLPALCMLAIIPVLIATLLLGHYFYRRIDGYTGDCLGASQQVAETIFYLSVSALWIFI